MKSSRILCVKNKYQEYIYIYNTNKAISFDLYFYFFFPHRREYRKYNKTDTCKKYTLGGISSWCATWRDMLYTYAAVLSRRDLHQPSNPRWKIRKSHSGSLDNPAVLMFPCIPRWHVPPPPSPPPTPSPLRSLRRAASSIWAALRRFLSVVVAHTRDVSPMIPKAPSATSPSPGATQRAQVGKRDTGRESRALNPDIWCTAVTCKSGQSPVPLRFQIFKVCLDSLRARALSKISRALLDERPSNLQGSIARSPSSADYTIAKDNARDLIARHIIIARS